MVSESVFAPEDAAGKLARQAGLANKAHLLSDAYPEVGRLQNTERPFPSLMQEVVMDFLDDVLS